MKLRKNERAFLTTLIAVALKLLESSAARKKNSNGTRKRRSGADAARLRKQIRAARKQKSAGQQSDRRSIGRFTPAYVYQIGK